MSNGSIKPPNKSKNEQKPNVDDDFNFDIDFDQNFNKNTQRNDIGEFELTGHEEENQDDEEEETGEYDEGYDDEEHDENYDFEENDTAEDINDDDYDFEDDNSNEPQAEQEDEQSLAEDLREFQNIPPIKIQSTTSIQNSFNDSEAHQEETDDDYNNDDGDAEEVADDDTANDENDDDYDFDDNSERPSTNDDADDFNEDEVKHQDITVDSKIAQILHKKKKQGVESDEKFNKKNKNLQAKEEFGNEQKNRGNVVKNHFDTHKTKIILVIILILISSLWGFASQIGITTKNIPTFKKNIIKILKAQGVQMQYTIREHLIFHKASIEIHLNDITTMHIDGTTALSSEMFSGIQHNLHKATLTITNAKINITSLEEINIQSAISELSNTTLSSMFKKITITNTTLTTTETTDSSEKNTTNSIVIKNLIFENTPEKTLITGIILTNSKPIEINYSYTHKNKNLNILLKSPAFSILLNGTKQTYGTSSKDTQIKGSSEIVLKNLQEFTELFGINRKISQNLTHLPQATFQFVFEYSSLNQDLKISQGKINALNSFGTFALNTTPESYQGKIIFDIISITDILTKLQTNITPQTQKTQITPKKNETQSKIQKKTPNKIQNNVNKSHILSLFSIITPKKPIEINVVSKSLTSKNESLLQNFETNLTLTKDVITLESLNINAGENTSIIASGQISNIQSTPISFVDIVISGQGNYRNIISKIVEITTNLKLNKELTTEQSKVNISILNKKPSTSIAEISIEIQNTLSLNGSIQHTDRSIKDGSTTGNQSIFQNITITNTNLNHVKIDRISFPKGITVFQNVINENAQNVSKTFTILNSTFKDISIQKATFNKETQKDILSLAIDINTDEFQVNSVALINIQNTTPVFYFNTTLQNITNFQKFYNTVQSFFEQNIITIPSFEKLDGGINLTIKKSIIFGKSFEDLHLSGKLTQGILTLPETQFSSQIKESEQPFEKPLAGKLSGVIDLRRQSPSFDLQIIATNIAMDEFKEFLPFKTNIGGSIYGGGSFSFIGTTYNEMLNTLKTTSKFVIEGATFSKLNLDFLGQHLLKPHKNITELDSDYIKQSFEKDSSTKANFIFSMNGSNKKFTIEECTIKTAYSGGVCYGNVTIFEANKAETNRALIEVIAKFAIPALDINKSLNDVMKLYISSKIKQDSEKCEITNDFSQINQYTSYRKTTFSS